LQSNHLRLCFSIFGFTTYEGDYIRIKNFQILLRLPKGRALIELVANTAPVLYDTARSIN